MFDPQDIVATDWNISNIDPEADMSNKVTETGVTVIDTVAMDAGHYWRGPPMDQSLENILKWNCNSTTFHVTMYNIFNFLVPISNIHYIVIDLTACVAS